MASKVNTDRETLRRATKLFTLQRTGPNIQTLEIEAFLFRPLGGFVRGGKQIFWSKLGHGPPDVLLNNTISSIDFIFVRRLGLFRGGVCDKLEKIISRAVSITFLLRIYYFCVTSLSNFLIKKGKRRLSWANKICSKKSNQRPLHHHLPNKAYKEVN